MESIIKFSFPTLTYKCSLNQKGRRRYGTLEELFKTQKGYESTVGIPDGTRELNTDIRNSIHYTSYIEFDFETNNIIFNNLVNLHRRAVWNNGLKYDIIEYKPGGFFKEHQDRQLKSTHYGTLLIFPPALGDFAHTGGDLILDHGKFQFDSSKNTEWTFIAFMTDVFHECKEVLSGRRIVLKTSLYSETPINRLYYLNNYLD